MGTEGQLRQEDTMESVRSSNQAPKLGTFLSQAELPASLSAVIGLRLVKLGPMSSSFDTGTSVAKCPYRNDNALSFGCRIQLLAVALTGAMVLIYQTP